MKVPLALLLVALAGCATKAPDETKARYMSGYYAQQGEKIPPYFYKADGGKSQIQKAPKYPPNIKSSGVSALPDD